jgi:hypothetical protein
VAGRTESGAVYAAGVAQGIVLVTFPAASMVFTDRGEYDLSSTQRNPPAKQTSGARRTD